MIRPSRVKNQKDRKLGTAGKVAIVGGVAAVVVILVLGFTVWNWQGGTIAPPTEYGIEVVNTWDGEALNDANISYWVSDTDGLPNEMVASGTPDNISMLTWDFISTEKYWAKTELAGFQTKWTVLDINDMNTISLVELPTANSTGLMLNSTGGVFTNTTTDNGTIRFTFSFPTQNGTGFEPVYDAVANETIFPKIVFTFNSTPSEANAVVESEIEDEKEVSAVDKTLTVPVDLAFICGENTSTNYLELAVEVDLGASLALVSVDLVYNGVVYGTVTL